MLNGIDVSNWQNAMNFAPYDFVIIKATEGNGWLDDRMGLHTSRLNGKEYGLYHYARPDLGNTPEAEAEWFLSQIKKHIGKCILALDWEGNSLAYPSEWAHKWLKYVFEKTGIRPLLYVQSSQVMTGNYKTIADDNYGLWVAHWGVDQPSFRDWTFWALWQYQGSPLDSNYFNGNIENFRNYYKKVSNSTNSKPVDTSLTVGDKVQVLSVLDYNGVKNDDWVLSATFDVLEKNGNRVVIGRNGALTGVWKENDLKKI